MQRVMTTPLQIRHYWASWLVQAGKFQDLDEVFTGDYCFACGMDEELERAHIVAHIEGGDGGASNLHLLCHACHRLSELLSGDAYFVWFMARNAMSKLMDRQEKVSRSERTKQGLQRAKENGTQLGAPVRISQELVAYVRDVRASGLSLAQVAQKLNDEGFTTPTGKAWAASNVSRLLARTGGDPLAAVSKGGRPRKAN
jgi:Recombinase